MRLSCRPGVRAGIVSLALVALALPVRGADDGSKIVDDAWVKGMKANDVEAVLACYAADAVVWFPGDAVAKGEKAVRALYQGLFSANTVKDVAITESHYKTSGNLSSAWGTFSMMLAPKVGGSPVTMAGRFTSVSEKRGGKWVYVADHASAEPAPAPAASAEK